jgi:cholesterol transport system auxiliary component
MKAAPALALMLALSACGPIVQIGANQKPPQSLLTIGSTAPMPVIADGNGPLGPTIAVDVPSVPMTLQTVRLPVTTSPTDVSYLAGAIWAEQPNRQFRQLVADTLSASGFAVINRRETSIPPSRVLSGTLLVFGLDVSNPDAAVVRVRYDAQLTGGGKIIALRRFDASVPVTSQSPTAVAQGLNVAANQVAGEISVWARQ